MAREIGFHDSNIVSFVKIGDEITIKFEGVNFNDIKIVAIVYIKNCYQFLVDGNFDNTDFDYSLEGDVLELEIIFNHVSLLVNWMNYASGIDVTNFYEIKANDIRVKFIQ